MAGVTPPPSSVKVGYEFGKSPVAGPGAPYWPGDDAAAELMQSGARSEKSNPRGTFGAGSASFSSPTALMECTPRSSAAADVSLSVKRARYRTTAEVQTESQELVQVRCARARSRRGARTLSHTTTLFPFAN